MGSLAKVTQSFLHHNTQQNNVSLEILYGSVSIQYILYTYMS